MKNKLVSPLFVLITFTAMALFPLDFFGLNKETAFHYSESGVIYVSTNGDDHGTGSRSSPFYSSARAMDEVRRITDSGKIPPKGIIVYLKGGDYFLENSIQISSAHNGLDDRPTRISSYPGQRARLSGGIKVSKEQFSPAASDQILDRLIDQSVRKSVLKLNLRDVASVISESIVEEGL